MRWGFARRMITNQDEVLEVGCGQDTPLLKVMSIYASTYPKRYVGVDLNKPIGRTATRAWATLHWGFNFIKDHKKLGGGFTKAVSFEVIEHMQKASGGKLLKGIYGQLRPGGQLFLSTPVFNGKFQAKVHIHEYTIDELKQSITKAGFKIQARYGTFMNINDVKKARPEHRQVCDALRCYYADDVLATFLAPLYPDLSRNNFWVLSK